MRHRRAQPAAPSRTRPSRTLRGALRALSGRARRGEEGFTLLAVLGVMSVGLLLATTVVTVSLQGTRSASAGRGTSQAQAAAEGGVNAGIAWVRTLDRRDYTRAYCSDDNPATADRPMVTTVYGSPGSSTVTTTFAYYRVDTTHLASAVSADCPLVNNRSYLTVVVTSTAVYTSGTGTSPVREVRTVKGVVDLTSSVSTSVSTSLVTTTSTPTATATATATPTATSTPFGAVVFVNDSLSVSNSFTATGDVVTNGTYSCTSGGTITGNLTAAGTGQSQLTNSCGIDGNTAIGGYFSIPNSSVLTGTLTAASTQTSTIGNTARVRGATTLRGTVTINEGTRANPVFPGGLTQNSTSVTAPVAQAMPVITYNASDWSGSTTKTAAQWGAENATRNGAPSWAVSSLNCTLGSGSYSVNGPLVVGSGSTVIDARSCRPLTLQDMTVNMSGDLTIFASAFTATGTTRFVSADGAAHNLRIIVPAQASTAACSQPDSGGDISANGDFRVDSAIKTFFYSTATTNVSNTFTITGSIYTCKANFSNAMTVTYSSAPVLNGSGTATATSTPVTAPVRSTPTTSTSTVTSTTTSTADVYDTSGLRGLADVPNS